MPLSLQDLEQQRSAIVGQFADLGDLRPGSITATSGRCGKPNCRCHRPNQRGHGPTDRLTYKVEGKSVSEALPSPAARSKADREVAEFRKYQQLSQQFVEINTRICRLRPIEKAASSPEEKKTVAAIEQEITREVSRLLRVILLDHHKSGRLDLEAVEMAMRMSLHQAGAAALSQLLQCDPPGSEQRERACPCGPIATYRELRPRRILTVLGEVELRRPYYLCAHCGDGQFPLDAELDVVGKDLSPGVRRMMALVGQSAPFDHGREQMKLLAGLEVTTKSVERTAEAIGEDIGEREQELIQRAVQLDLPVVVGKPIPILYIQMDGTGVPVTKAE